MTDAEREFLRRYEALCRETGLLISGCGCCSSPYLCSVKDWPSQGKPDFDPIADNIAHLSQD